MDAAIQHAADTLHRRINHAALTIGLVCLAIMANAAIWFALHQRVLGATEQLTAVQSRLMR